MAKLHYSAIASLDGYVADESGDFGWSKPDDEVHAFVNDLERPIGTYLYGRRMYEVMVFWETAGADGPPSSGDSGSGEGGSDQIGLDYAEIWRAADKIVFSKTLDSVSTAKTRLERSFDSESIRRLKAESTRDLSIGGPELAARALADGLVDECHLFLSPIAVGGGKPCLPRGARVKLSLLDERRFANGVAYLRYGVD